MRAETRTGGGVVAELCELCGCEPARSFHHLIPRTTHRNKWFKKKFRRDELQAGLHLCGPCHDLLHQLFEAKELGREFNTREKLAAHPEVAKYLAWRKKRGWRA
jgi:hypothetical protein